MAYLSYLAVAPILAFVLVVAWAALRSFRAEPAARTLSRYLALALWLVVANACELLVPTEFFTTLFAKLEYFSILLLPITFLWFCMQYTGHDRYIVPPLRVGLLVVAGLLFTAVATNELHWLFWTSVGYPVISGFMTMRPAYGPLFWVVAVFTWSQIALGCFIVIRSYIAERGPYRKRSFFIVAGALAPAVFNLIHVFRLIPGLGKDYTPLGFALAGLFFFASAYLNRAAHVIPLARCIVLQELEEGVVFVDPAGRLTDYNAFAESLLGLSSALLGRPVMAIRELDSIAAVYASASVSSDGSAVAPVMIAGRSLVARAKRIGGGHGLAASRGVAITLADVSERVRIQDELDAMRADLLKREHFAVIGRLSADIAREISVPLDYVRAEFSTIKDITAGAIGDGEVRARVFGMEVAAEDGLGSIDRVVQSLLEYAKRRNGDEMPVPYDLARAVKKALELSRSDYSRVAVVDTDLEETPQVLAHGSEIDRVLLNILRNAAGAVRDRSSATGQRGRIWVKTRLEDSTVVCEIGNDGTPLAESDGARVFEEFFSVRAGIRGAGLGLFISRDIVERRHSGKLALVSRAPVVFRMELPLVEVTAPSP